jgi:hypothetical protein
MTAVLERVQRLEQYLQTTNGQADRVMESTLDKLLNRERQILRQQLARLRAQTADFETRYGWPSEEFNPRFQRGELGDDMDFIEWSATLDMIANLQHGMSILDGRFGP